MSSELAKILHDLVLNNSMPAKDLAKAIGKPYSTLLREINPYDNGAKLGIETLLQIMKCTNSVEPLHYMAAQLGYKLEAKTESRTEDSYVRSSLFSSSAV